MARREKILDLPAMVVPLDSADVLIKEIQAVALEKTSDELVRFLKRAYAITQQGGNEQALRDDALAPFLLPAQTEEEFVRKNLANDALVRLHLSIHGQKWVFLSRHGNLELIGPDFDIEDLPKDIYCVQANATGLHGKAIIVNAVANPDPFQLAAGLNRMIVQGEDQAWVEATHERLKQAFLPQRSFLRTWFYKLFLLPAIGAFLSLCLAEYRVLTAFYPTFHLTTPLNGLSLLALYLLLVINFRVVDRAFVKFMHYAYPYFEIEGNLSRPRKDVRAGWILTVTVVYGFLIEETIRFFVQRQ